MRNPLTALWRGPLGKYHLCEMKRTVVAVDRQGRITLPVDVRRRLRIGEGTQLELKTESNTIRLRRASTIPGEDRWAYTPAAIASLRRAHADVKAGRVFELSERALVTGNYPRRRLRGGRADSRKGAQLPVPVEWRRTWTGEPAQRGPSDRTNSSSSVA